VGLYELQVQLKLWAFDISLREEKGTAEPYIKEEKKICAILQR
jgi:hypothetical protein